MTKAEELLSLCEAKFMVWFPEKTHEFAKDTSAKDAETALKNLVFSIKGEIRYQGENYGAKNRRPLLFSILKKNNDWNTAQK